GKFVKEWGALERFPGHSAWTGQPSPFTDRQMVFGSPLVVAIGTPPTQFAALPQDRYTVPGARIELLLADALRFNNQKAVPRALPAGRTLTLQGSGLTGWSPPFGGTFANLILLHLNKMDPKTVTDASKGLNLAPPPLNREGERVQPNWLYQFLLGPRTIRP